MSEEDTTQDDVPLAAGDQGARAFLDEWLTQASAELITAARFAALPHTADLAFLALFLGETADLPNLVQRLQRAQILIPVGDEQFIIRPTLRRLLIADWQTSEPATFRQASRQAADYFYDRLSEHPSTDIEYIYHVLGYDEARGLQLLAYALEKARSSRLLGRAQRLVRYAREQGPLLSPLTQNWIRYFAARVELANGRYPESEALLAELVEHDEDPYLHAQSLLEIAKLYIQTQRWRNGFEAFAAAEAAYLDIDDSYQLARFYEAQAAAYVHLASALGGLMDPISPSPSPLRRLLDQIQHLPFLAYRGCSRRIKALPNIYFSSNYQDWFIVRVYHEAISQYEKAASVLSAVDGDRPDGYDTLLVDIEIRLADLQQIVGRWRVARDMFAALGESPHVRSNEYRQATLNLALGRAALMRGSPGPAVALLREAYDTYRSYEDLSSITTAGRLLGRAELATGNTETATTIYLESGRAARESNDVLAATEIESILSHLQDDYDIAGELRQKITEHQNPLADRAYIARFPGELLERFRFRAARVIAPIIFLLVWILGIQVLYVVAGLETFYSASRSSVILTDLGMGILFFLGLILLTVWGYELIYVVTGYRYARKLPLAQLSRHQPKYVLLRPDALLVHNEAGQQRRLPWAEVEQLVTADRAFWSEPIPLYSQFYITAAQTSEVVLEGIFRLYGNLKSDVAAYTNRVNPTARDQRLDYSFLRTWWAFATLLLTFLMAYVAYSDLLDTTYSWPNLINVTVRESNVAYVTDVDGGIWAIDLHDPSHPENLGRVDFPWHAAAIALDGPYAVVAAGTNGLRLLSVEDPIQPSEVGYLETNGPALDVSLVGQRAFVAAGTQGLLIVDISDPTAPKMAGSMDVPGYAQAVTASRNLVFVVTRENGIWIAQISPDGQVILLGNSKETDRANKLAIRDNLLFVVDEETGLFVIDVTDPVRPEKLGHYPRPGLADIDLYRAFILLSERRGGLRVIHFAREGAVSEVGHFVIPGVSAGLAVSSGESLAYVAITRDGEPGVLVIDILNPEDSVQQFGRLNGIPAQDVFLFPSYPLSITSLVYPFLRWARILFPLMGLARLLSNRWRVRRALRKRWHFREDLPAILALSFLLGLLLLELRALTL